ncbi:MAG: glycoside hydrolase family 68 protein, partial [Streptococcus salivarius]
NDEVVIKSVENDHILFGGDNYHYQSYPKFMSTFNDDHNHDGNPDRTDNYCLRDPHIIEDNGSRYLIFESNTGDENYQGEKQIYNWSNYGGDDAFNLKSFLNIVNNKHLYNLASWANGSIGILKLDDNEKNPSVAEFYTPLVTSHMVTDEVERPSVVKMGNKYYLFTASRINKSTDAEGTVAAREAVGDDVVMLGFVSDSLRGKYRPLNGSGVVLTASVPADWRTSTYSYYAVPVEGSSDTLLVTSYMTNRGGIAGAENKSTWAPSFLIKMNADDTTEVLPKMTNQGDWIWDKSSESLVHVGDQNSAKLPNEDFNVDYYAVSGYGLKPHTYPTVDGSTGVSEAHGVLTVTVKDGKDKKADKPETPVSPTEGNHSVDDKTNKPGTSKPADNNQPSADKEDKPTNPTNPDSPARTPFPYYGDHSNDNNSSNDHHVAVPVKPSTGDSVGDRRPVAQAAEIATPVPKTIVATGPTVPTNTVKEESVTETEAPKPVKSEEKVQSHGVDKANEVTKSDESSKGNNTKVAAKLATTPKTPSDSEGSNSNILSILATIFAAIASLALLGYGLVTGKIHLPKK